MEVDWAEVPFELECSISPDACYLTTKGDYELRVDLDPAYREEVAASCWLEPPINATSVELGEWSQTMTRLREIAVSAGIGTCLPADTTGILSGAAERRSATVNPGTNTCLESVVKLQVAWEFFNLDCGIVVS